jgi:pyridoxal phosphate enzyme (YggS family)
LTSSITENLNRVRAEITRAAIASHRDPADVRLIAVSKTKPAQQVALALTCGQMDFGENYVQEAVEKIRAVAAIDTAAAPVWHFIGAIQTNKTRDLAACFDWVHTVDREKVARRLHEQRPVDKGRLNICLQINVDEDPNKAGASIEQAAALLEGCRSYENLALRGLMTILDPRKPAQEGYNRLRDLFEELAGQAPATWDTLSMGMSGDYPAAIAAGATLVRVGTAIFGERGLGKA